MTSMNKAIWDAGLEALSRSDPVTFPNSNLPRQCPVCGANGERHPADGDYLEWAGYDCRAEIVQHDDGKLEVNDLCRDGLELAVQKLNSKTEAAQSAD